MEASDIERHFPGYQPWLALGLAFGDVLEEKEGKLHMRKDLPGQALQRREGFHHLALFQISIYIFMGFHTQILHGAGIFTDIYPQNGPKVGKYSIHGASGIDGGTP